MVNEESEIKTLISDLRRLLKTGKKGSGLTLEQRQNQIAALPEDTDFSNIYPDYGWTVLLRRKGVTFRKHFMDLTEAVACRDQHWENFEIQRRTELLLRRTAKQEKRKTVILQRCFDKERLLQPTVRPSGLTFEERRAQIEALPPGVSFINIYPDHGWRVMMRRGGHLYFGGHFMDLSEAVAARDRMWASYEENLSGTPDT